jgi:hypothetical protein
MFLVCLVFALIIVIWYCRSMFVLLMGLFVVYLSGLFHLDTLIICFLFFPHGCHLDMLIICFFVFPVAVVVVAVVGLHQLSMAHGILRPTANGNTLAVLSCWPTDNLQQYQA